MEEYYGEPRQETPKEFQVEDFNKDYNYNSEEVMIPEESMDIDGDGKISKSEINLCKLCIAAAIVIAFGDQAIQFI